MRQTIFIIFFQTYRFTFFLSIRKKSLTRYLLQQRLWNKKIIFIKIELHLKFHNYTVDTLVCRMNPICPIWVILSGLVPKPTSFPGSKCNFPNLKAATSKVYFSYIPHFQISTDGSHLQFLHSVLRWFWIEFQIILMKPMHSEKICCKGSGYVLHRILDWRA